MRTGAAEIEALQRRAILRPTNQRAERKELIERLLAVMNVSAAQTVSLFEIQRRDYLLRHNSIAQSRRIPFQDIQDVRAELVSFCGPIPLLQFVRRKLHVH